MIKKILYSFSEYPKPTLILTFADTTEIDSITALIDKYTQ